MWGAIKICFSGEAVDEEWTTDAGNVFRSVSLVLTARAFCTIALQAWAVVAFKWIAYERLAMTVSFSYHPAVNFP